MLSNLLALNLGFFVHLILGNIYLTFSQLAMFSLWNPKTKLLPGFVLFMCLLWGAMDVTTLMGWKMLTDFHMLEFFVFQATSAIFLWKTSMEKFFLPVNLAVFFLGSWLIS
jgi:hypothetical protein